MPKKIIDLLKSGRSANQSDPFRKGNVIGLPGTGSLIVSGDIHGHRRNFQRIISFADLPNNTDRHLVLQEIIHGGPEDKHGNCLSFELLFEAVRYKLQFPDRVHLIMGNHDTAFINNTNVMKAGKEMNTLMRSALQRRFGRDFEQVDLAMRQFLFSQPLAVRCQNRIWLSHSLPADHYVDKFDIEILNRPLKVNDIVRPSSAYLLTWGRTHSPETLNKMAGLFDVDVFILGHQPQETGFTQVSNNTIIIASDHNHGVLLPIDLAKSYTVKELINALVPLASIC